MKIKIFTGTDKFSLSSEIETYINSFRIIDKGVRIPMPEVNIQYSTTPIISKGDYEYCTQVEYSALVMIKFASE